VAKNAIVATAEIASAAIRARVRRERYIIAFAIAQLASGEKGEPGRWRFCLITTAPIEIAARTATAIRIGTSGEEPPSLDEASLFTG
jgi:hypothetical protein